MPQIPFVSTAEINAFVARYGPEGCKDKTVKKLNARIWRAVEKRQPKGAV